MARRDDDGFVEFAAASRDRLRRTAYLMCGDWHRSSDIVQEALIRVYVAWPRLERKGALTAYARRAVVSVAIDQSRRRSSTELSGPVGDHEAAGDLASGVADRDLLMKALASLPKRQRACVVLRYYEDLPVAEVATLLEINAGNVKSQTSRALASLKAMFEADDREALLVTNEGGA